VIGTGDTMKIIIAPQAFKGSLKAHEAAEAMSEGVKSVIDKVAIVLLPLADGGEGTVKAMVEATKGRLSVTEVHGPLGEMVAATWGIIGGSKTAVIEMAAASGLNLLPKNSLDAMSASTLGTGELIQAVLEAGYRRIIIGLGDSATSDGGTGMAQALGIKLLDVKNQPIPLGGKGLSHLEHIDVTGLHPLIKESIIICACDVTNLLYGKEGAAYVYGPQKGATPEMVRQLDSGLRKLADIIRRDMGKDISKIPGGGAAGGLAAGLLAFLDASLQSGIDIVCDSIGFDKHLVGADLVLTGEGRIDRQTSRGKTISGIAMRAKKAGVPVIAFAGEIDKGYEEVYNIGIDKAICIVPNNMGKDEAIVSAARLVKEAVEGTLQSYLT
jgi:glycerate kinase